MTRDPCAIKSGYEGECTPRATAQINEIQVPPAQLRQQQGEPPLILCVYDVQNTSFT